MRRYADIHYMYGFSDTNSVSKDGFKNVECSIRWVEISKLDTNLQRSVWTDQFINKCTFSNEQ